MIAAAMLLSAAEPSAAESLMVAFARAMCTTEVDRVAAAQRLVPSDWIETEREERRGVTYGADAPVPRNDRLSIRWRGRVGGAAMWLWVRRDDFADPARPDYSSASFGVSPDTAIGLDSFNRRVPFVLHPRWQRFVGRGTPRIVLGDYVYPEQPRRYGWLQHYVIEAVPADPRVEITARHFSGAEYPQQMLDVACATAYRPDVPHERLPTR